MDFIYNRLEKQKEGYEGHQKPKTYSQGALPREHLLGPPV